LKTIEILTIKEYLLFYFRFFNYILGTGDQVFPIFIEKIR